MSADKEVCDAVSGVEAIGRYLGLTRTIVRRRLESGKLPSFERDGEICVRRSVLVEEMRQASEREARRRRAR